MSTKYEIEIWGKDGRPLADIRQFCTNFSWSRQLNGADTISFEIDLNRFEKLVDMLGYRVTPYDFFEVGRCDIRIKRNGKYVVGGNVYRFSFSTSDPTINMAVECVGYLNFYKTQYVTASFDNVPQEDILWAVINQCNQKPGGDYGIRRGTHTGESIIRTRNYARKEVASLIQQMSNVIGGCDFDFTPDKLFNTFEAKGTYRPSVILNYPGNIQDFSFSRSIEKVANYIYAIGSGNGSDAIMAAAEDANSENYLYRRERILTWNSVTRDETITEHANSALHQLKDIIELPSVTLRPDTIDLSVVETGDTISLAITSNVSLKHINGDYRIEQIDCRVDDNDAESVSLTFDSLDIDEIIASQNLEGGDA